MLRKKKQWFPYFLSSFPFFLPQVEMKVFREKLLADILEGNFRLGAVSKSEYYRKAKLYHKKLYCSLFSLRGGFVRGQRS